MHRAFLAAILVWAVAAPALAQSPSPAASPAAAPAAAQLTALLNKSPGKIWAVDELRLGRPPKQKAKCDRFPAGTPLRKACECFHTSNGWFDPADGSLNFAADNRRLYNKHTAYDATFIVHEYGHFLHKMLNEHFRLGFRDLGEQFEAKCIGEAFSDLFSCAVTNQSKWGKWVASSLQKCTDGDAPPADVDASRDLEVGKAIADVIDERDEHTVALAFSTGVWKLRSDGTLGGDDMVKTLIAGMRMSPLPSHFRHAAISFVAADQMLASTPHTQKIVDMFKSQGIFSNVRTAAAP